MIADTPPEWLTAASHNHQPRWRVQLLTADGDLIDTLPVTRGTVSKDATRTPRTTVGVDVPTPMVPRLLDQRLLPSGDRIRVEYSINADDRWVTVADVDQVATSISRPDGFWVLAGADRSARIDLDDLARGGFTWDSADTAEQAITRLVRRTFPNEAVNITAANRNWPVPELRQPPTTGSPWRLIEEICTHISAQAFYDGRVFTVANVPQIIGPTFPVDTVGVGETGVLTAYVVNHEMGYNTGIVTYRNPDTNETYMTGTAVDNRADSPVAVNRIGSHVVIHETIDAAPPVNQWQANSAANNLLFRQGVNRSRRVELRHPTRPWLEPGDIIEVTFLGGPTERLRIESVEIPLLDDNIQITRMFNTEYRIGDLP